MFLSGRSYGQPGNIDAVGIFGLYIRHRRYGVHQIVPNIYSGEEMYSFIFNHDPVEISFNGERRHLPPYTLSLWDGSCRLLYGSASAVWHVSWLQLFPAAIEGLLREYKVGLNTTATFDDERVIDRFFLTLIEEFSKYAAFDPEIVDNTLRAILLHFRNMPREANSRQRQIPPTFRELLLYIEEHFRNRPTLGDMARQAKLDPVYLSRKFKEYYGCGPADYAMKLRLDEAAFYLQTTSMSIKEVAAQVGYDDIFHFSKIFKSNYGVSPKVFRAQKPGMAKTSTFLPPAQ